MVSLVTCTASRTAQTTVLGRGSATRMPAAPIPHKIQRAPCVPDAAVNDGHSRAQSV